VGDVRTICLVGHSGSGKTALARAILQLGGVEAQLDTSPEAQARGGSVDLNVAGYRRGDQELYVLDAPGFGEFIEESYKGLRVAETGVLVLNAEKGLEVLTEKAWALIEEFGKPALALVHRMDLPNAKFGEVVEGLKERFEAPFTPVQWPIHQDGRFVGVVDILEQKAVYFDGRTGEVPPELKDVAASAREALLEGLAEVDEALMERFLNDEEISADEMRRALRLHEPRDEFVGLVFNAASDQYLGMMAYVKVYGGAVKEGDELTNVSRGQTERVREVLRPAGDKPEKAKEVGPGQIAVLTKLAGEFALGDTFAASDRVEPLKLADFPKPVFPRAIEPLTQQDEEKMSAALRELARTKATIEVYRDDTIVSGMGDTQLGVLVERLKSRFGVGVRLLKPRVPYKETITSRSPGAAGSSSSTRSRAASSRASSSPPSSGAITRSTPRRSRSRSPRPRRSRSRCRTTRPCSWSPS